MLLRCIVLVALLASTVVCGPPVLQPKPLPNGLLPKFKINSTFVSGVSSGAYMAGQMHVAYATHMNGAALFAGGPYYCARGQVDVGLYTCAESWPMNDIQLSLLESISSNWSNSLNDPISAIKNQPVWIHHGSLDFIVWARVVDALFQYYDYFDAKVTYHNNTVTNHAWISPYGPVECDLFESPYIANCGWDAQQLFLTTLFGSVNAPNTGSLTGTLYSFNQSIYVNQTWNPTFTSANQMYLDDTGFLYVPAACSNNQVCRLVTVFHGCQQGYHTVGLDLVNYANMNQYADTNAFIVFYPQAIPSSMSGPNPEGCWDWWGYVQGPQASAYAQRNGYQMKTLMNMMFALGTK